jgi:hypothetical protein
MVRFRTFENAVSNSLFTSWARQMDVAQKIVWARRRAPFRGIGGETKTLS